MVKAIKKHAILAIPVSVMVFVCTNCSPENSSIQGQSSITGPEFSGAKLFRAWAANLPWDPDDMLLETRFDVGHMSHIFQKEWGGKYEAKVLLDRNQATRAAVLNLIKDAKNELTPKDMYIQYSSGHGSPTGLLTPSDSFDHDEVNYDEIRDEILQMQAQEVVVFMMACFSGGLIESFKRLDQTELAQQWQQRTLFIMTSSTHEQTSATGPGTDPEEPITVEGTAGSRFGNFLWKALSGEADQNVSGNNDGNVTLGEIEAYVKQMVAPDHDPQVYGFYNAELIMAQNVGKLNEGELTAYKEKFSTIKAEFDQLQIEIENTQQQLNAMYEEKGKAFAALNERIAASKHAALINSLEQRQKDLQMEEWRLLDEYRELEKKLGCGPDDPHHSTALEQLNWAAECDDNDRRLLAEKLAAYKGVQSEFRAAYQQQMDLLEAIADEIIKKIQQTKESIDTLHTALAAKHDKSYQLSHQLFEIALELLQERLQ